MKLPTGSNHIKSPRESVNDLQENSCSFSLGFVPSYSRPIPSPAVARVPRTSICLNQQRFNVQTSNIPRKSVRIMGNLSSDQPDPAKNQPFQGNISSAEDAKSTVIPTGSSNNDKDMEARESRETIMLPTDIGETDESVQPKGEKPDHLEMRMKPVESQPKDKTKGNMVQKTAKSEPSQSDSGHEISSTSKGDKTSAWKNKAAAECSRTESVSTVGSAAPRLSPSKPMLAFSQSQRSDVFFEGWYIRVCVPSSEEHPEGLTFAFIYAHEQDPDVKSGRDRNGTTIQVITPDDDLFIQTIRSPELRKYYWNRRERFDIGQWAEFNEHTPKFPFNRSMPRTMDPNEFFRQIKSGFQLTMTRHQGIMPMKNAKKDIKRYRSSEQNTSVDLTDASDLSNLTTSSNSSNPIDPLSDETLRWSFSLKPIYLWGPRGIRLQKQTGSWLSTLPLFETGYQVISSHQLVSGWVQQGSKRVEFENAYGYMEKNWGTTFPSKWFWMQCNLFNEVEDATFTALGAVRKIGNIDETVGLVAIHIHGSFYEFANWACDDKGISWEIAPWGSWKLHSSTDDQMSRVDLEATANIGAPVPVLGPTKNGMKFTIKHSANGNLKLRLVTKEHGIICLSSSQCAVEVGGGPWETPWVATVKRLPLALYKLINAFN